MLMLQRLLHRLSLLLFSGQPFRVMRMLVYVNEAMIVLLYDDDERDLKTASALWRYYFRQLVAAPWSVRWRFLVLYLVIEAPVSLIGAVLICYSGLVYGLAVGIQYAIKAV